MKGYTPFHIHGDEMFGLQIKKMAIFHPLEVVGRGSETQLLVNENLNYLI